MTINETYLPVSFVLVSSNRMLSNYHYFNHETNKQLELLYHLIVVSYLIDLPAGVSPTREERLEQEEMCETEAVVVLSSSRKPES